MSKHNSYTNYRNMAKPVDEAIPEEVKEEIAEVVTEETANVEVEVDEPVEEKAAESLIGVVNCKLLNIRKKPSAESEVVTAVPADTVLMIEPDKSSEEWYKVYTEAGVEGFCMKKFVAVKG